jgi:hypothetical protein
MNDNGNIRLLTPENDMRVRAFLSSLEELSEKVEKIRENNKPSLGTLLYRQGTGRQTEGQPQEPSGLPKQRHTALYPDRRQNPVQGFRHRAYVDGRVQGGVPSEWKNQVLILPHIMGIRQVQLFISESASQVH